MPPRQDRLVVGAASGACLHRMLCQHRTSTTKYGRLLAGWTATSRFRPILRPPFVAGRSEWIRKTDREIASSGTFGRNAVLEANESGPSGLVRDDRWLACERAARDHACR